MRIMKILKEPLKIAVLDDSDFYNKIITKQIESYGEKLYLEKGMQCQIQSFVHADDFVRNITQNFDVVVLDYFLGNGITGYQLIDMILLNSDKANIAIVSQTKNIHTSHITVSKGARAFFKKDKDFLHNISFFIEDVYNNKILNL